MASTLGSTSTSNTSNTSNSSEMLDSALLAVLATDHAGPSPDSRALILEQALWGDDGAERGDDGAERGDDGDDHDGLLELLLGGEDSSELAGASALLSHDRMPDVLDVRETCPLDHEPQQFQPLQVAALPNRRNLARRSRAKMFKCKPNKARDGRREELLYLSQKVSELEAQLADIKRRHASSKGGTESLRLAEYSSSSNALLTAPQRSMAANVWRAIAARQSDERVKAERENIRLKLVLEHQIKIAKSLEGILHKKLVTKDIEKCVQGGRLHHVYPPTLDSATDEMLFAELLAGVAQSYAEVDAVFAANRLDESDTSASDAQVRSDGAGGMFLEFFANKVIPFDVATTGAAVWQHFVYAKERTPYRFYYNKSHKSVDTTEDTVVENFNLELHANSTRCSFRVKQVLRRYVEDARVVIVWRAFVDPIAFSDELVSGVRFHEKGYIVVKRPETIADERFALLQQCGISTPMFTDELMRGDHPQVGAITDFVLSSTAANISASRQMIENVLLEQAMRQSAVGDDAPLPSTFELLDV